jgi:hypothetical protein
MSFDLMGQKFNFLGHTMPRALEDNTAERPDTVTPARPRRALPRLWSGRTGGGRGRVAAA